MKILRMFIVAFGGLAAAAAVGAGSVVFGAGVFWLYVFGDDPWPGYAEPGLLIASAVLAVVAGIATGLGLWKLTGKIGFGRSVR